MQTSLEIGEEENGCKDLITVQSHSGWEITYAGCAITGESKMQTLTALSTTEAEYVLLSLALRDKIPLMELMKEIIKKGMNVNYKPP